MLLGVTLEQLGNDCCWRSRRIVGVDEEPVRDTELVLREVRNGRRLCFFKLFSNCSLTVGYFWANFERPVLGCIDAKCCK